jgi:hypothetical protein
MVAHRPHAARTVMAEAADAARLDLSEALVWSSCTAGTTHDMAAKADAARRKRAVSLFLRARFQRCAFLAEP